MINFDEHESQQFEREREGETDRHICFSSLPPSVCLSLALNPKISSCSLCQWSFEWHCAQYGSSVWPSCIVLRANVVKWKRAFDKSTAISECEQERKYLVRNYHIVFATRTTADCLSLGQLAFLLRQLKLKISVCVSLSVCMSADLKSKLWWWNLSAINSWCVDVTWIKNLSAVTLYLHLCLSVIVYFAAFSELLMIMYSKVLRLHPLSW